MIEFVKDWYEEIAMVLAAIVALAVVVAIAAMVVNWVFWGGGTECVDASRHLVGNAVTGRCHE